MVRLEIGHQCLKSIVGQQALFGRQLHHFKVGNIGKRCVHIFNRLSKASPDEKADCGSIRSSSQEEREKALSPGLYVVGTPVGNLDDMTFRAIKILREVDTLLCEDTRHTRKLLSHYNIGRQTESYHCHNESSKKDKIIRALKRGVTIALVSDAGMPTISDPGSELVAEVTQQGIRVIPVPGPSASLLALVASGLVSDSFTFCGFIHSKSSQRIKQLERYKDVSSTLIYYVSPHALKETLKDCSDVFGSQRKCCLAREITKMHEEFFRSTLIETLNEYTDRKPKGEFTLVIEGNHKQPEEIPDEKIIQAIMLELENGQSHSSAAKAVSQSLNVSRKRAYELSLSLK